MAPPNNPNTENNKIVASIGMSAAIVAVKKLFETVLVNTAAEYFPFPFKPKKKEEKVTVLTTVTKTMFRGERAISSHTEYAFSDWNEDDDAAAKAMEKAKMVMVAGTRED